MRGERREGHTLDRHYRPRSLTGKYAELLTLYLLLIVLYKIAMIYAIIIHNLKKELALRV